MTLTGAITCDLNPGTLEFNTPLQYSNTVNSLGTLTATLTGCSGDTIQSGVTITGAIMILKVRAVPGNCSVPPLQIKGKVKYTTTGGTATPTRVWISGGSASVTADVLTVTYSGASFPFYTYGSFGLVPAMSSSMTLIPDDLFAALGAECGGSGIATVDFTGVNGSSTITLSDQ
ncbi:MAG: hypothetical protein HY899_19460 [Deltaproteobacteria bacterium]|nr:hypothetical protein [Deltaproteobacteria bacterium]